MPNQYRFIIISPIFEKNKPYLIFTACKTPSILRSLLWKAKPTSLTRLKNQPRRLKAAGLM